MFVATVRVHVKAGYAEQFEQLARQQGDIMREVDGLIEFRVLRPCAPGKPYVNYSLWQSEQAMQAFGRSPVSARAHAGLRELDGAFDQPPRVETFEVVD